MATSTGYAVEVEIDLDLDDAGKVALLKFR